MRVALASCCALAVVACARPDGSVPDDVFGHCIYVNRFSDLEECREFRGTGWTRDDAQASCDEYDVEFVVGACDYDAVQGACVTSSDAERAIQLVIPGDDAGSCAGNERGCELFGGGTWVDGAVCGGVSDEDIDDAYDAANFYVPETQTCEEVGGASVCTWNQISGCTQEGLKYEEHASCENVLTQRPYSPVPADETHPLDDPRLNDPTYAAELSWVRTQIDSCACACCHKGSITPEGAAIWDTEANGNFANTFTDWGIGFAARAFDSSLLGSYDAADNNGFSRFTAGLPSTDEPRMKRFFEGELSFRGLTVADFANESPAHLFSTIRPSTSPKTASTVKASTTTASCAGRADARATSTCSTKAARTPACPRTLTYPKARCGVSTPCLRPCR